jgi:hypothetical protein
MASTSYIEIPERFQSKHLRIIEEALRYVPSAVNRRDIQTTIGKEAIICYNSKYIAHLRVEPNDLVNTTSQPHNRRLRKHLPNDLPTRLFFVLFVVQFLRFSL